MAAKLSNLFRGAGRNALDLPVAGLSALAAAFAAFAIPQDVLSRAVVATGLPSLLSAAQPPLGLTARVALAVAGAVLVFGIVLLALRLLDRSGSRTDTPEESRAGPRVRRRDGHPDAPTPRPISAARDLGEPAPPRAPRAEVPLWLDEAVPTPPAFGAAPEPAFEAEPQPEPDFMPEPNLLLDQEVEAEAEPWRAPEPLVFPEPAAAPAPLPEPAPVLEFPPEPAPLPEPEHEPIAAPVAVAGPLPAPEPGVAQAPAPKPQAEMPTSIAGLMERLEQGLARRRTVEPAPAPVEPAQSVPEAEARAPGSEPPQVFAEVCPAQESPQVFPEAAAAPEPPQVFPEAPAVPESEPEPEAANDRLQSAIASLQRLAARSA